MREIHLIPECHEDDWHTTKNCWCRPAELVTRVGLFQTERIVFHQEAHTGDDE